MRKIVIHFLIFTLILSTILFIGCSYGRKNDHAHKIYVGSINSNIYHYPHCEWAKKIYKSNEIWFSNKNSAEETGYRACKICCP